MRVASLLLFVAIVAPMLASACGGSGSSCPPGQVESTKDPAEGCVPAGTGGGPGTCAAPNTVEGCGSCATFGACTTCAFMVDPDGMSAWQTFDSCARCVACATACGEAGCTPSSMDPCDSTSPGVAACTTCQQCAAVGSCSNEANACMANTQCQDLLTNLQATCGALPM